MSRDSPFLPWQDKKFFPQNCTQDAFGPQLVLGGNGESSLEFTDASNVIFAPPQLIWKESLTADHFKFATSTKCNLDKVGFITFRKILILIGTQKI